MEARGEHLNVFLCHFPPYYILRQGLSLNLEFTYSARLVSQLVSSRKPPVLVPVLELEVHATSPNFYVATEEQMQVLILALAKNVLKMPLSNPNQSNFSVLRSTCT